MFVVTTRRATLTAYVGYFDDQVLVKRQLILIFDESGRCFFVHVEIICGVDEKQFV